MPRPLEYDLELERLEKFLPATVRQLAAQFGIPKSSIHRLMRRNGLKFQRNKGMWVKIRACPKTDGNLEESHERTL